MMHDQQSENVGRNLNNPYVGPKTFQPDQWELYFGRNREARELLSLLIARRIVLFYAQSGAGKSSLINASLIRDLDKRGYEVLPVGRVSGENPDFSVDNIFVYNLMTRLHSGEGNTDDLAHLSLTDFLLGLVEIDGGFHFLDEDAESETGDEADDDDQQLKPRVLIIDQFEELFTAYPEAWQQQEDFFEQLNVAMREDPLLYVVLAMREDYLAKISPFAHLLPGELRTRYYMQRMQNTAAKDAIEQPANLRGVEFSPEATEALIHNLLLIQSRTDDDVKYHQGKFIEPVQLQVICYQLWPHIANDADGVIELAELEAIADFDLAGFVDRSLRVFYEGALTKAIKDSEMAVTQRQLRDWFSKKLITEARTRNSVYHGKTKTAELPNEAVYSLEEQFLIRKELRTSGEYYELVHDSFVDPILEANIEWREEQLLASPLAAVAIQWENSGYSELHLLDGRQLELALQAVNLDDADPLVVDFLEKSDQAEKQRKMKEADEKAEEAEREAKRERKINGHLRLQRVVIVGLLISMFIAAGVAFWQWRVAEGETVIAKTNQTVAEEQEAKAVRSANNAAIAKLAAEKQKEIAEEQKSRGDAFQLAAAANQSLAVDPKLSVLLAREAGERALGATGDIELQLTVAEAMLKSLINSGERYTTLEGHQDIVYDVAVSPDGSKIASASDDGTIKVWDAASGAQLLTLYGHSGGVSSVDFSPAGHTLLSGSSDGSARLWDAETGVELRNFSGGHSNGVIDIAFSPDGARVATASWDTTAVIWDAETGEPLATLSGHTDELQAIAFNVDGSQIGTASMDGTVRIWDTAAGEELMELNGANTEGVTHIVYSEAPRGAWFTSSADSRAVMWDAGTGETLQSFCCQGDAWMDGLAVSPDGTRLATGGRDNAVRIWDIETGELVEIFRRHSDDVWNLDFSQNQTWLVSASSDGTIIKHTLSVDGIFPQWSAHEGAVTHFAASGNNSTLASFSADDGVVKIWQITDAITPTLSSIITPTATISRSAIVDIALNADGSQLAVLTETEMEYWDLNDTSYSSTIPLTVDYLYNIGFDSEDKPVTAFSMPEYLEDKDDGDKSDSHRHLFTNERADIVVIITEDDGVWQLYRVNQGDKLSEPVEIVSDGSDVDDVVFSSDSLTMAAIVNGREVRVWRAGSDENSPSEWRRVLREKMSGDISDIVLSTDGTQLAIATLDTPDEFGNELGNQLIVIDFGEDNITRLAIPDPNDALGLFLSDNRLLVAREDGIIRAYWLKPQSLMNLACQVAGRNLSYDEWRQYRIALGEEVDDALVCDKLPHHDSFAIANLRDFERVPLDLNVEFSNETIFAAHVDLYAELIEEGLHDEAIEALEKADAYTEDSPARQRTLTARYTDLCSNRSGALTDEQRPDVCAEAERRALTLDSFDLTLAICEIATDADSLDLVTNVCDRIVQLAAEKNDLTTSLDVCALAEFDEITTLVAPACDQVAVLAQEEDDAAAAVRTCRDAADTLPQGSDDVADSVCRYAVSLAVAADDQTAQALNTDLCQNPPIHDADEIFAPACQRFSAMLPQLDAGEAVTGKFTSQDGDFWVYTGPAGVIVTIDAMSSDVDTVLSLQSGDDFQELAYSDDFEDSDSRIENFTLPKTNKQTFIVNVREYSGATGDYELRLVERLVTAIELGEPVTDTFAAGQLWQLTDLDGEVLELTLQTGEDIGEPQISVTTAGGRDVPVVTSASKEGAGKRYFVIPDVGQELLIFPAAAEGEGDYSLTVTIVADDSLIQTPSDASDWTGFCLGNPDSAASSPMANICAEALAGLPTLEAGKNVTGAITSTQSDFWLYDGQAGAIITIDAMSTDFDTVLSLQSGDDFQELAYSDDFDDSDSRIENFILPETVSQRFVIRVRGYSDALGDYELRLVETPVAVVAIDESVTGDFVDDTLWLLKGNAGQLLDVVLEADDPDSQPSLSIRRADGADIATAEADDEGASVTTKALLPADGMLFIEPGALGDLGGYSLTVSNAETDALVVGEAVQGRVEEQRFWRIDGVQGQILSVAVRATDDESDFFIQLYDPDGAEIGYSDDADGLDPALSGVILPADGDYLLDINAYEATGAYAVSAEVKSPEPLEMGRETGSDIAENRFWSFEGSPGQIVDVIVRTPASDVDTYLNLYSPEGVELAYSNDRDGLDPAVLDVILTSGGLYLIDVGAYGDRGDYLILVETVSVPDLKIGIPVTADISEQQMWRFTGSAGDIISVAVDTPESDIDPYVSLVGLNGEELASNDDNSFDLDALIPGVTLPDDGDYYIKVGAYEDAGSYRLTIETADEEEMQLQGLIEALDEAAGYEDDATVQATLDEALSLVGELAEPVDAETAAMLCLLGPFYGRADAVAGGVCATAMGALDDPALVGDSDMIAVLYLGNMLAQAGVDNAEGTLSSLQALLKMIAEDESLIDEDDPFLAMFQEWADRLEAGETPSVVFDDATIESLKEEIGF